MKVRTGTDKSNTKLAADFILPPQLVDINPNEGSVLKVFCTEKVKVSGERARHDTSDCFVKTCGESIRFVQLFQSPTICA